MGVQMIKCVKFGLQPVVSLLGPVAFVFTISSFDD